MASTGPEVHKKKHVAFEGGQKDQSVMEFDCFTTHIEYPPTKYIEPPFKGLERQIDDKTKVEAKRHGTSKTDISFVPETEEIPADSKKKTVRQSNESTNSTTSTAANQKQAVSSGPSDAPDTPPSDAVPESQESAKEEIPQDDKSPNGSQASSRPQTPVKDQSAQASPATSLRDCNGGYKAGDYKAGDCSGGYKAGDYKVGDYKAYKPFDCPYTAGLYNPSYNLTDCSYAPDYKIPDNYQVDSLGCVNFAKELPHCQKINRVLNRGDDGDRAKGKKTRIPDRFVSKWEVVKPYTPIFELEAAAGGARREAQEARGEGSSEKANVKTHKKIKRKVVEEPANTPPDKRKRPSYTVPVPKKSYVGKFQRLSSPVRKERLEMADSEYFETWSQLSSDVDLRKIPF